MDRTNFALMDGQHRQCSESLQRLAEALRSETDSATIAQSLGHLSDLIEAHFASEEALMRSYAYQLQTGHAADHDRGRVLIQNLAAHLQTRSDASGEILEDLDCWLEAHVRDWDTRLSSHLHSIGIA
jgi:hemerythrin-like metal-binding protein